MAAITNTSTVTVMMTESTATQLTGEDGTWRPDKAG